MRLVPDFSATDRQASATFYDRRTLILTSSCIYNSICDNMTHAARYSPGLLHLWRSCCPKDVVLGSVLIVMQAPESSGLCHRHDRDPAMHEVTFFLLLTPAHPVLQRPRHPYNKPAFSTALYDRVLRTSSAHSYNSLIRDSTARMSPFPAYSYSFPIPFIVVPSS